ncbi:MAG: hypothetical protein AAF399_23180 [Bacteroidota bacterium]
MNAIDTQLVEETADWLFETGSDESLDAALDEFAEAQPFLLAFLMSMGEGDFNEDEQESMLFLGVGIWKMMSPQVTDARAITEEEMADLRTENEALLESLAPESDEDFFEMTENLLPDYSQAAILAFLTEEVQQDEGIRPHNQASVAAFLKIVVDALDRLG